MTRAERVANGMALLDKRAPDWRERINVGTLDISDDRTCPLGQVFGYYGAGIEQLGLLSKDGCIYSLATDAHGFSGDAQDSSDGHVWDLLDVAWKEALS